MVNNTTSTANNNAQTPQHPVISEQNPLNALADMLDEDMNATNAAIMARMQSPVALIPQLASYLIAAGGKRIRPLMTLASAQIFNAPMGDAHKLAAAVEFIHTATLLHDDVVDGSEERRGKKAANLVFGNQPSVLVGDFLFSRAFELMTDCGNIEILKILSNAAAIIAEGEVLQLATANNLATTMDEYLDVIKGKTAALFAASCEVGPVLAGIKDTTQQSDARIALRDYGMNLGIAFQIADDALDYDANRETLGKNVGDDFYEGKITAPILFALEKATPAEREFWTRTLQDKNYRDGDLTHAQKLLHDHDAVTAAKTMAQDYVIKAQNAINSITTEHDDAAQLQNLLSALAQYTVTRDT